MRFYCEATARTAVITIVEGTAAGAVMPAMRVVATITHLLLQQGVASTPVAIMLANVTVMQPCSHAAMERLL